MNDKIKDNEKIARFMGRRIEAGWVYFNDKFNGRSHSSTLKYDSSWDELMPVVEKLNDSGFAPSIDICRGMVVFDTDNSADLMHKSDHGSMILATYAAVMKYLLWIESHKQNRKNENEVKG